MQLAAVRGRVLALGCSCTVHMQVSGVFYPVLPHIYPSPRLPFPQSHGGKGGKATYLFLLRIFRTRSPTEAITLYMNTWNFVDIFLISKRLSTINDTPPIGRSMDREGGFGKWGGGVSFFHPVARGCSHTWKFVKKLNTATAKCRNWPAELYNRPPQQLSKELPHRP